MYVCLNIQAKQHNYILKSIFLYFSFIYFKTALS